LAYADVACSAGNGNFNGQVYDIDRAGPTGTVEQAVGQVDPTGTSRSTSR